MAWTRDELAKRVDAQVSRPGHASRKRCPYTGRWCRCRATCALDAFREQSLEIDPERDGVRLVYPWEQERRTG